MNASPGLQRKMRFAWVTLGVMAALLAVQPAMAQQGKVVPKDTAKKVAPNAPTPKVAAKPGTGKVVAKPGVPSVSAQPGSAKVGVKPVGTKPDSSKAMKSAKSPAKVDCAEIHRVVEKLVMEKMGKGEAESGSLELRMEDLPNIDPADLMQCLNVSTSESVP